MSESADCFLIHGGECFRYRAGAVIVHERRVLMATNPNVDYFYSIGGAVQMGETAAQAAQREVLEETGVAMRADRQLFIHENFFDDDKIYEGKHMRWHELALFYLMKPEHIGDIRARGVSMSSGRERLAWLAPGDFTAGKSFPPFLPDILFGEHQGVRHVVTKDGRHEFIR